MTHPKDFEEDDKSEVQEGDESGQEASEFAGGIPSRIPRRYPMTYLDLPKDLQEWGRRIELQITNTIADAALKFQAAEQEAGRTVSTTEAVHHVRKRLREKPLPIPPEFQID